jgi:hypothetical protein
MCCSACGEVYSERELAVALDALLAGMRSREMVSVRC